MNLRKQLSRWLLGPEQKRLQELTLASLNDWRMVPYLQNRKNTELLDQIGEIDPHLVQFMLQQLNYTSVLGTAEASQAFREQVVRESRSLFLTDPVVSFSVDLWTDYAVGSPPNLTTEDEAAQEIWDEFFTSDRNAPVLSDRELHRLSEDQLVDGEIFFAVFASTVDGLATLRTIPTDQVAEILYDPEDSRVALFYRRDYTTSENDRKSLYYPDWHATDEQLSRAVLPVGAERADRVRAELQGSAGTDVVVLHAAYRKIGGRGWPLVTSSLDWGRVYKGFLQDRAAVAKAAATWVEKIKAKGGQRAIDQIRQRLGSSIPGANDSFERNPPPVAGSTWIENEALSREWMNRPTNAGDAEKDGIALLTQLGLGMKLYPHYLGRGDYYRLATATAMEGPMLKSFNRYQSFWASVWRDMAKIVLLFQEQYGSKSFTSHECTVSSDAILDTSPESITAATGALTDLTAAGLVDPVIGKQVANSLLKTMLESIGTQNADEVMTPEGMEESLQEDGMTSFEESLRAAARGLWSGVFSKSEFQNAMETALDIGLSRAWKEGLAEIGLSEEDMTQEEYLVLDGLILEQMKHIAGLADFIDSNSKANEGKLASIQPRLQLWNHAYSKIRNQAKLSGLADPPLTWVEGPTQEKCDDCVYADGRTHRASVWKRWGWETQSQVLECQGFECQCDLVPAEKGTRVWPGHPRRPKGK
jgi:hypothetical protein